MKNKVDVRAVVKATSTKSIVSKTKLKFKEPKIPNWCKCGYCSCNELFEYVLWLEKRIKNLEVK
jgi:hypothetical protein